MTLRQHYACALLRTASRSPSATVALADACKMVRTEVLHPDGAPALWLAGMEALHAVHVIRKVPVFDVQRGCLALSRGPYKWRLRCIRRHARARRRRRRWFAVLAFIDGAMVGGLLASGFPAIAGGYLLSTAVHAWRRRRLSFIAAPGLHVVMR